MQASKAADLPGRITRRLDELERNRAWFARKMGLDLSHVYRWLTGERPIPQRHLARIAEVLELPEAELRGKDRAA